MTAAPLSPGMLRASQAAAESTPGTSSVRALAYRSVQPLICRATYPCGRPIVERGGGLAQQFRREARSGGRLVGAQDHAAHALHQVELRADQRFVVAEGDRP